MIKIIINSKIFIGASKCFYKPLKGVVKLQGITFRSSLGKSMDECKAFCSKSEKCKSLVYDASKKFCRLKDKEVSSKSELKKGDTKEISVAKICKKGKPT